MNLWFSWCELLAFVQQRSCTGCAMQEHGPVQYQCAQLLPGWGPTTCVCVWEIFSLMWCFYSAGFSQNLFASFCFVVTVKRETRIHQTTRRFAQYFGLEFDMSLLSTTAPPIGLASEYEIWESRISESFTGRSVMLQCHQKQDCRPSLVIFVYLITFLWVNPTVKPLSMLVRFKILKSCFARALQRLTFSIIKMLLAKRSTVKNLLAVPWSTSRRCIIWIHLSHLICVQCGIFSGYGLGSLGSWWTCVFPAHPYWIYCFKLL